MDYTESGLLGGRLFLIASMAFIVGWPFAKGALIHLSTRLLRFETTSYWRSFFCVLIGLGTMMLVKVLAWVVMTAGSDPTAMLIAGPIVVIIGLAAVPFGEAYAALVFFKESPLRIIGCVALANAFVLGLLIPLFFFVVLVVWSTP